jgi:predicted short-subunit dehydrogenase-like oxidoreductase (DUF2520 family)
LQYRGSIKSVSIIGAGNVGWHLACAFHFAGIEIKQIYSRNYSKAKELAQMVSAIPVSSFEEWESIQDLCLLCVSDDAIGPLLRNDRLLRCCVVHTSGSTGMEVFPASEFGQGILYPLQTFTRGVDMDYSTIPFLVEGNTSEMTNSLIGLAGKVSATVIDSDSQMRRRIHTAAVFACNFGNHMSVIADKLLKEAGMDIQIIRPLIEQTYIKMNDMSPEAAQTGPAQRGDNSTLEKHLEELKDKPLEQEIYKLLSENILRYRKEHE